MHAYSKPLGSVTARSSRISYFTKIGMAMDIQGYGVQFYRGYFSLSMVAKSKTLTLVP